MTVQDCLPIRIYCLDQRKLLTGLFTPPFSFFLVLVLDFRPGPVL